MENSIDLGDLPENCPPPEAKITYNEVVYRFVATDPPDRADFLSWRDLNPDAPLPQGITECQVRSLSVSMTIEGLQKTQRRVRALRNKKIASARLHERSGMLQYTPSRANREHHSWWRNLDIEVWQEFEIVEVTDIKDQSS